MKTKRNFVTLALAAAMLLLLSACGKEVVSLVPVYKGDTVTTTDHTFTTGDFDVYLTYSDGTEEVLHDGYEITPKRHEKRLLYHGYHGKRLHRGGLRPRTARYLREKRYRRAELNVILLQERGINASFLHYISCAGGIFMHKM